MVDIWVLGMLLLEFEIHGGGTGGENGDVKVK